MIHIDFPTKPQQPVFEEECKITPEENRLIKHKEKLQNVVVFTGVHSFIIIYIIFLHTMMCENTNDENLWSLIVGWITCIILGWIAGGITAGFLVYMPLRAIVDNLSFFNPPKYLQKKIKRMQYYRSDSYKWEKEWAFDKYERDMKRYNEIMEQIDLKHPELKGLNYNLRIFNFQLAKSFVDNFHSIMNHSKFLIDNEANSEDWNVCTNREFEEKTARWYSLCGYEVKLTQQSNDGGIDVIATKGKHTIYVQCKQYKNKVPVSVARELYGVMAANNVEEGAIVCLSGADKGTRIFANENNIKIITAFDICRDISNKLSCINNHNISYSIEKVGNEFLYNGFGTFYLIPEPFDSIFDLIKYLKNLSIDAKVYEVAVITWNNYLYPIYYCNNQRQYLCDQIVSYIVNLNTYEYKRLFDNYINTTISHINVKSKPKRRYNYYRRRY